MEAVENKILDKVDALAKREHERQLEIKKRKEGKVRLNAENETLGVFQKIYEEERQQIEKALDNASYIPVNILPEHFENIYKSILKLQKHVAASNVFLRVYDIQKSNKQLQELTNKAKELEDKLLPKKRFGFKNRGIQKPEIKQKEIAKDEVDCRPAHSVDFLSTDICGFKDRSNEVLTLNTEELLKKDVTAQNLSNCTVRFYGNPSTLHLSNLQNTLVLCGPVSTSVFAENCQNCTFVIACQQLRLHSSKTIKIYLHVTSKGIIEDCNNIFVAPYNFRYKNFEDDFKNSGLDVNVNHWKELDDFNWLNLAKHSPNWSILSETLRIKNWDNHSS